MKLTTRVPGPKPSSVPSNLRSGLTLENFEVQLEFGPVAHIAS